MADKVHFIKLMIKENGKNKIKLILPAFLITFPLHFIPESWLNKKLDENIDIKGIIGTIKNKGKGTKIQVNDNTDEVEIVLK